MNTKIALGLTAAALVAACTSTPSWDTSVFPNQVVYGADAPPAVAQAAK
jgi:hypothetical protein